MVVSKETLSKIRKIIDRNYSSLLLSLAGDEVFTQAQLAELRAEGIDTDAPESLLEMIYYHYVVNPLHSREAPSSIEGMKAQQAARPTGTAHSSAEEHINQNFAQVVEKQKANVMSRIEGLIRDNNNTYRNDALQNLDRPEEIDQLIKESTVGHLKQRLRDYSGDANRDFDRIAITEVSNSIGLGSVDRVIIQNKDTPAKGIYVYRIPIVDASLCKYCRKFYLDSDGSPKVYRLATLLNNGTNYGKKASEWKPVVQSTHPNDRESGVLQLKPGWKVLPGGGVDFIGLDNWDDYIKGKLEA